MRWNGTAPPPCSGYPKMFMVRMHLNEGGLVGASLRGKGISRCRPLALIPKRPATDAKVSMSPLLANSDVVNSPLPSSKLRCISSLLSPDLLHYSLMSIHRPLPLPAEPILLHLKASLKALASRSAQRDAYGLCCVRRVPLKCEDC